MRGTGAATLREPPTLCRALFPRASGRRVHGVHLDRAPWPSSAVEFASSATPFSSRLCRTCTSATCDSCNRRCITDQVPRGQRAPLDHFRVLLIDRSAESVESSLPGRGGTWCRSRKHQSPAHSADSSRDSLRRHALWTHLDLHVEAVTSCHHSRRQLSVLPHLELRVEDHYRSSFLC